MPPWEKYQSAPSSAPWEKYAATEPMTDREAWESSMPVRFLRGVEAPAIAALKAFGPESISSQLKEIDTLRESGMKKRGAEGFDVMGLLGSIIPGAAIGSGVSKALPAATSVLGKMGAGAVTGGVTAGSMPVQGGEELSADKLRQIGTGAAAGGAIPLVAHTLMGAKAAVEPFYKKGQEAIIGRTLQTASGGYGDDVANALAQAKEIVPGSKPTVGQAANNAGIASLERATSAISPESTEAFKRVAEAQNTARAQALASVAKDQNAMVAAEQARKAATAAPLKQLSESAAEVNPARTVSLINKIIERSPGRTQLTSTLENVKKSLFEAHPLEQRGKEAWAALNDGLKSKPWGVNDTEALSTARTVFDRVKTGKIGQEEALEQLKGLKAATPEAGAILDGAKELLKAADQKLRSNAAQLYQGARKNMTDLLAAKAGDGSKLNEAISRELTVVMKSLDHQINKAEPAYGQFMQKFAEASKPINQMQIGQEVQKKATNAVGQVNLNPLAAALSDKTAQRATGFKRATMEGVMGPEQMATLKGVKDDLIRAVQAERMAGTAGSDTVKKLAYSNLIDRAGVPTFLREFAPTQIAGNFLARGADTIYGGANRDIAQKLAETLLNPQEAARMMRQVGPSRYQQIIDSLMQQGSAGAGVIAGRNTQ